MNDPGSVRGPTSCWKETVSDLCKCAIYVFIRLKSENKKIYSKGIEPLPRFTEPLTMF